MNFDGRITPFRQPLNLVATRLDTVVIGVCTYKRPRMLANCLKALSKQMGLDTYSVQTIVVDNCPDASAKPVADEADKLFYHCFTYIHEPRRGIPQARNRVLAHAREQNASWVVFIDDDEVPDPYCVASLLDPKFKMVAIVYGDTIPVDPERHLPWKFDRPSVFSNPSMSNIRLDSRVIQSGLEFNESLSLTGGEDEEFFTAAVGRGYRIAKTSKAVTFAEVHPERHTYRSLLKAEVSRAALLQREVNRDHSPMMAIGNGLSTAAFRSVRGVACYIGAPAIGVLGLSKLRQTLILAGTDLAHAAGRVLALFGRLPEPFRTGDGH